MAGNGRQKPSLFDPEDDPSSISPGDWIKAVSEILTLPFEDLSQEGDTFDSEAERRLFEDLLPSLGLPNLLRFWQRQVSIGSLTGDSRDLDANRRVDFVFAHPDRFTLVVEIDGGQHSLQQNVDSERDALLRSQAGVRVLRIPTTEIDAGDGPALARLRAELSAVHQEMTRVEDWRGVPQVRPICFSPFPLGVPH